MAVPTPVGVTVSIKCERKEDLQLPAVFYSNPKSDKGVIVLQEWWGMNDQIKEEAAEIARDSGFNIIVPDLYRGKVATDNETAQHYMSELDWQGAIADIKETAKFLLSQERIKAVGVMGFCMGGALAMAATGLVDEISAGAPFYGICGDGLCDPSTIKKPLQCHFGTKDDVAGFSDPEAQKKLKEKLDAGKVNYEFHSYEGAGHAFTNKTGPLGNYKQEACDEALRKAREFFKKVL